MTPNVRSTIVSLTRLLRLTLFGSIISWSAFGLISNRAAIAADLSSALSSAQNPVKESVSDLMQLRTSGALNGLFCTPSCGLFFEEGRERFEREMRVQAEDRFSIDRSIDGEKPALKISPNLSQERERWQQELERAPIL